MPTSTTVPQVTARMRKQAERIEKRRRKLNLSKTSLAGHAGVSAEMITVIERGDVPQRSAALPKIIEALNRLEQK